MGITVIIVGGNNRDAGGKIAHRRPEIFFTDQSPPAL